jgi:hypothetical protein
MQLINVTKVIMFFCFRFRHVEPMMLFNNLCDLCYMTSLYAPPPKGKWYVQGNWSCGTCPIMLSPDGNLALNPPHVVYVSQHLGSHPFP